MIICLWWAWRDLLTKERANYKTCNAINYWISGGLRNPGMAPFIKSKRKTHFACFAKIAT